VPPWEGEQAHVETCGVFTESGREIDPSIVQSRDPFVDGDADGVGAWSRLSSRLLTFSSFNVSGRLQLRTVPAYGGATKFVAGGQ